MRGNVTYMLAALASGYHGPQELTFARAFTSWRIDPWSLAAIVLAGALYLVGVRRIRRSGELTTQLRWLSLDGKEMLRKSQGDLQ